MSGLDQVDSYDVSDGVCVWVGVGMCVCVTLCCMCETCLSKKDVGFHADMLCGVTNLFPLSQLTYCNKEHFLSV